MNVNPPVPYGSRSRPHTDPVNARAIRPGSPQYGPPPALRSAAGLRAAPAYGPPPRLRASEPRGRYRPRDLAVRARAPRAWPRPPVSSGTSPAGLTIAFSLVFLGRRADRGRGRRTWPCSCSAVLGRPDRRVRTSSLRRRSAGYLFASAAPSVGVLVLSLIVGLGSCAGDLIGQVVLRRARAAAAAADRDLRAGPVGHGLGGRARPLPRQRGRRRALSAYIASSASRTTRS